MKSKKRPIKIYQWILLAVSAALLLAAFLRILLPTFSQKEEDYSITGEYYYQGYPDTLYLSSLMSDLDVSYDDLDDGGSIMNILTVTEEDGTYHFAFETYVTAISDSFSYDTQEYDVRAEEITDHMVTFTGNTLSLGDSPRITCLFAPSGVLICRNYYNIYAVEEALVNTEDAGTGEINSAEETDSTGEIDNVSEADSYEEIVASTGSRNFYEKTTQYAYSQGTVSQIYALVVFAGIALLLLLAGFFLLPGRLSLAEGILAAALTLALSLIPQQAKGAFAEYRLTEASEEDLEELQKLSVEDYTEVVYEPADLDRIILFCQDGKPSLVIGLLKNSPYSAGLYTVVYQPVVSEDGSSLQLGSTVNDMEGISRQLCSPHITMDEAITLKGNEILYSFMISKENHSLVLANAHSIAAFLQDWKMVMLLVLVAFFLAFIPARVVRELKRRSNPAKLGILGSYHIDRLAWIHPEYEGMKEFYEKGRKGQLVDLAADSITLEEDTLYPVTYEALHKLPEGTSFSDRKFQYIFRIQGESEFLLLEDRTKLCLAVNMAGEWIALYELAANTIHEELKGTAQSATSEMQALETQAGASETQVPETQASASEAEAQSEEADQ